jgi:N-succinyldiaminopimelate aminotransferase
VQAASSVAWQDEQHVIENRALYKTKFEQVTPLLQQVLDVKLPDAGFYLWAGVNVPNGMSDTEFAKQFFTAFNVTVLPGSYLARDAHGVNPGQNRIRMALVAGVDECVEAAQRLVNFTRQLGSP